MDEWNKIDVEGEELVRIQNKWLYHAVNRFQWEQSYSCKYYKADINKKQLKLSCDLELFFFYIEK
jgi:hypothetical protein